MCDYSSSFESVLSSVPINCVRNCIILMQEAGAELHETNFSHCTTSVRLGHPASYFSAMCVWKQSLVFWKLSSVSPGDPCFTSRSVPSAGLRHSRQCIPYRRGKSWRFPSPSGGSSKHCYHGHKLDRERSEECVCVYTLCEEREGKDRTV